MHGWRAEQILSAWPRRRKLTSMRSCLEGRRGLRARDASQPVPALRAVGRPLDTAVRSTLKPLFDFDFSAVRIFPEESRPQAAGAAAQTFGRDIAFAPGKYDPASPRGQALIAHELAHVVQQDGAQPDSRPTAAPRNGSAEMEARSAARR